MIFLLVSVANVSLAAQQSHQAMQLSADKPLLCDKVTCAKTVTSAFAPNGDLWRVWALNQRIHYQISADNGVTFSTPNTITSVKEKVSARGESRPKIAFDRYQGVYISWAMPKEKKYTADVRFIYSSDYGKTFTQPITVNNDNLVTGHRFNEMLVTEEGDISIVWLDSRLLYQLKLEGKPTNGSALYLGRANYRKNQTVFSNEQLANNTCVCCRLAMDYNNHGELAILWRHIYGDNVREFALMTVPTGDKRQKIPHQISYDHWQINGCPHQGGAISVNDNNRYHMVWFNQGDLGKGIFYAASEDQGITLTKAIAIGDNSAKAAHPHLNSNGKNIDIVWTQYTGTEHQLWHQRSIDNGQSFAKAKILATTASGSDRPFIIKKGKLSFVSWHRPKIGHLVQVL